jgi:methylmalonyl-CoA mutase C-terminal domain/subunit
VFETPPIPRVLLTKSFIDSHDRAIKTIGMALRDASMEVILTDYEIPEDIITVALEEDVDVIGVSFMSGGQVLVTQEIMRLRSDAGIADVPVVVGGAIRPFDVDQLLAVGVSDIFRGGEKMSAIVERFQVLATQKRAAGTST